MAISWNFDAKDVKEHEFEDIPDGKYRVRIDEVIEQTSQTNGCPQLKITLSVNGFNSKLFYRITFNPEYKQQVNDNIASMDKSFGMPLGTIPNKAWVGKTGAVKTRHREYNGNQYAEVHYFIKPDGLPEWKVPGMSGQAESAGLEVSTDDLPF